MGYIKDLDEYRESELEEELAFRKQDRDNGRCDYCHRPVNVDPPCRFRKRHAGETE